MAGATSLSLAIGQISLGGLTRFFNSFIKKISPLVTDSQPKYFCDSIYSLFNIAKDIAEPWLSGVVIAADLNSAVLTTPLS
jgi:hypothetical protein